MAPSLRGADRFEKVLREALQHAAGLVDRHFLVAVQAAAVAALAAVQALRLAAGTQAVR